MRVKQMHPLCCIPLDDSPIGDHSPDLTLSDVPRHLSDANAGSESASCFAGVLYKWTNYGKGWRSRWFILRNGVISYSKLRVENRNVLTSGEDVRIIGDASSGRLSRLNSTSGGSKVQTKPPGIVHLKVILQNLANFTGCQWFEPRLETRQCLIN